MSNAWHPREQVVNNLAYPYSLVAKHHKQVVKQNYDKLIPEKSCK